MTKSRNSSFRSFDARAARAGLKLASATLALMLSAAGAAAAVNGVMLEKPWMRFIIKARPAGGYFTLRNNTASAIQLVGASSPACGMVMLHQTKEVNGVEKMLPVKSVAVPAHGVLKFAPGGYHIMCMSPGGAMKVGAKVPVTLNFAGGQSITAEFPVTGPNGR
jgi:periplasmic copper chaperone A